MAKSVASYKFEVRSYKLKKEKPINYFWDPPQNGLG